MLLQIQKVIDTFNTIVPDLLRLTFVTQTTLKI